jgi:hypothetical protein
MYPSVATREFRFARSATREATPSQPRRRSRRLDLSGLCAAYRQSAMIMRCATRRMTVRATVLSECAVPGGLEQSSPARKAPSTICSRRTIRRAASAAGHCAREAPTHSAMIIRSDNDADTSTYRLLGGDGLTAVAQRRGIRDFAAAPAWGVSRLTAPDGTRLILRPTTLSHAAARTRSWRGSLAQQRGGRRRPPPRGDRAYRSMAAGTRCTSAPAPKWACTASGSVPAFSP